MISKFMSFQYTIRVHCATHERISVGYIVGISITCTPLFRIINLFKLFKQNTKPNIQNNLNCIFYMLCVQCVVAEKKKKNSYSSVCVFHMVYFYYFQLQFSGFIRICIFEGVASNSFNDRNNGIMYVYISPHRGLMYFDVKVAHIMS